MVLGAWSICIWHATSKKSPFCCIPPNCRGYCSPIKAHNCKADVYSERESDCYSVKICSSRNDQSRKRPLIVFDGSSSNSGPLKVKKPEGATSSGAADRLKPPPAANLTNPIRKLSSSSMMSSSSSLHRSTVSTNLKQEGNTSVGASYSVFISFVSGLLGGNFAVWFSPPCDSVMETCWSSSLISALFIAVDFY